ncbi:cell division protein FtsL [Neisseria animalis]|uniref:Cell division protein FtsL n=1 Tax=Neisseria animalis TaxID=492 RepID=A0A5P3MQK9_NEIAN|nr:cell division protein FtsL [Neisseria animalis]QEY23720.1 cell division protein FtsL [Neisseria animalis]ROW32862.1 cell division protein FtsL [Neisseria animalis]VEE09556.1 cell division protein FtsL-related protein [Neisseria animalis]
MTKLNIILLLAAFVSGFFVVTVQNQSRQHFIELDKAQKQEIKLEEDFSRLKLEQARLANHKLIKVAAEKQKLKPPAAHNTVMVERGK